MRTAEQWGMIEFAYAVDLEGIGNPFVEVKLGAVVSGANGKTKIAGFYDGEGVFKLRFMPQNPGDYTLTTYSNLAALSGKTEAFTAAAPEGDNHGPVVADKLHFRYADGSRFFVMGTTAYVWHLRPEAVRKKTLDEFTKYGFNKIRMLFFPKHYTGNFNRVDISYEPPCYPFAGEPGHFDFTRPNPRYFREFEERLQALQARGILADVILFHPYDFGHWDIDSGMDEDAALFYVRYLIARISAFRNVWWSLANEYDIHMADDKKTMYCSPNRREWDVIGETVKARDPYHHPISCHNITFGWIYPDRPWMSHVSYQHPNTYDLMMELRRAYNKPVINDEYQYEGNLPDDWGNCTGEMELERHWRSVMAGGYATHGEAFVKDNNRDIFWSYGGEMVGTSAPRLRFLKELVEKTPFEALERDLQNTDGQHYYTLHKGSDFYLIFMRSTLPGKNITVGDFSSPERYTARYRAQVFDVWNCKKVREEELAPSSRLPITEWTAVILEKL